MFQCEEVFRNFILGIIRQIYFIFFFNLHLHFCPTCLDLILAFEPRNFFGDILPEYDRVLFSGPEIKNEIKISLKLGKRAKILFCFSFHMEQLKGFEQDSPATTPT